MRRFGLGLAVTLVCSCGGDAGSDAPARPAGDGGKADGFADERSIDVLLTDPHCDICESADKSVLQSNSRIAATIVELVDAAQERIDVAQYTFSDKNIEAALVRAHDRGVDVRLAMDSAQEQGDTVALRLRAAGLDVHFVKGKNSGLQHAKYMLVDDSILAMGSNNWSSTGVSINEENTLVVRSSADDPLLAAFACDFAAIFAADANAAAACSTDEVQFAPSSGPFKMIRDELRGAKTSIDVLMHHLVFDDAVTELAKAAERGVRVRVIVNAADRGEVSGSRWDRLLAAGGEVRFKQDNAELFQLMHDKLAIVDERVLLTGSGNWSGSGFFDNFEFFARLARPDVVAPYVATYARLWQWSLTGASLDAGTSAAAQDAAATSVFFGNLHAHFQATEGARKLDDGKLQREVDGVMTDVSAEVEGSDIARWAFEYGRDRGELDFLALTPHVVDDRPDDAADQANMTTAGFAALRSTAQRVTEESDGTFLALAGSEWSTSSLGNHLGVLGTSELPKVARGRFDLLYGEFLPARAALGDRPIVLFAHPHTFAHDTDALTGEWDQMFGRSLLDVVKASERNVKFNDYGLDDFPPLSEVRPRWLDGSASPDEAVVAETLANLRAAADPYARLVEVTVNRGNELASEIPTNPSLTPQEDGTIERFVKIDDWFYYLGHGFRLAPVASHDNHFANFGTGHTSRTAVISERLDERHLLSALAGGAVYASEDEDLELRVYADGRVRAGQAMATTKDAVALDVRLSDPDFAGPFAVSMIVGTVGGTSSTVLELEVDADAWQRIEVPLPSAGDHWVVVQVHEREPDRMAWSAPVFVRRL